MKKEEIKRMKTKGLKNKTQLPNFTRITEMDRYTNGYYEEATKKNILDEPENKLIFKTEDDNMTILNSLLENSTRKKYKI